MKLSVSLMFVLLTGISLAQPQTNAVDPGSRTLYVYENETVTLDPLSYNFDHIVLQENAIVYLLGQTSIFTKKLSVDYSARFEYVPGSDKANSRKKFTLLVSDGTDINGDLVINGSGADGATGATGHNGARGSDESCKLFKGCRSAGRGQSGGTGGRGEDGEHGMDISVTIKMINPESNVHIISKGGDGGQGGTGGTGGVGGNGKYLGSGASGGDGGDGGQGGNGGNGGLIIGSLVYPDSVSQDVIDRMTLMMEDYFVSKGGEAGLMGFGGPGASGARGGMGPCPLVCSDGGRGFSGRTGNSGENGLAREIVRKLTSLTEYTMRVMQVVDENDEGYLKYLEIFNDVGDQKG